MHDRIRTQPHDAQQTPPDTLTRRRFLAQAASAAALAARPSLGAAQATGNTLTIATPLGRLTGTTGVGGIRSFLGVPFAHPPFGDLRFRPPQPVTPWSGTRDATRFAPGAMQETPPVSGMSEDCLYLNVWAPPGKGPFPVYVWIHGGGFTGGSPSDAIFDGTGFARSGIVQVNIAYRLGVFGFLDVSPLLGMAYAGSANNALRDILCALSWVQDNIAAFGGDPARVTLGGESAGAKLTDILLGTPAARTFFQHAVSESGGAERVAPAAVAAAVANGFGQDWKQTTSTPITALKTAPAATLIDVQKHFTAAWPQHFPLRPQIDAGAPNALLTRLPIDNIAAGNSHGKRLLLGTNLDESTLFIGPHPAADPTAKDVGNMSIDRFLAVLNEYARIYPNMPPAQRRIRALSAEEYLVPSLQVADAHTRNGNPAWVYTLTFAETSGRLQDEAFHSLDLRLVFNQSSVTIANASAEAALAGQMHNAWAAFVRGEAPAAAGLPSWPAYNLTTRPTMMLNTASRVDQNPFSRELPLWQSFLKPNGVSA